VRASARAGRGLLLAALLAAVAGRAQAQVFVTPLCATYVSPTTLRFDTAEHARWYKRFWTGECDHLFGCMPGRPNWNEVVAQLAARADLAERPALPPKACTLGQRIGLDWSREHDVRRISTADLRRYYDVLKRDGDPLRGLDAVARAVDADLKRLPRR